MLGNADRWRVSQDVVNSRTSDNGLFWCRYVFVLARVIISIPKERLNSHIGKESQDRNGDITLMFHGLTDKG